MKNKTFACLAVLIFILPSCGHKKDGKEAETELKNTANNTPVISLAELRMNPQDYLDREVSVATYLFTHEEGPWIGDYTDKPLLDTLSLKTSESSELVAANSSQFRWWFVYQKGYPIIISGVFRVGDWMKHGQVFKEFPYLEVAKAREVGSDDEIWSSKKTNGLQSEQEEDE